MTVTPSFTQIEMKTCENQNSQCHQNVSLKKHLRHPELESQRLDFARLRFVRQSTHVSIHLLQSSLDPVEQQIKHDRHPQLYTNRNENIWESEYPIPSECVFEKALAPSRIRIPEARFCEAAFREGKHTCVHPSSEIVPWSCRAADQTWQAPPTLHKSRGRSMSAILHHQNQYPLSPPDLILMNIW